jgi:hypothetical protein
MLWCSCHDAYIELTLCDLRSLVRGSVRYNTLNGHHPTWACMATCAANVLPQRLRVLANSLPVPEMSAVLRLP